MLVNRIDACFEKLKKENKKAFVAYLTAGDPNLDQTLELIAALERAGTDIIELGVPFSDPVADGPVIQLAFQRALNAGTTLRKVIETVSKIRLTSQLPLIIFTYYNPVMQLGFETFAKTISQAGADGVLILDLPPEEAKKEISLCEAHGLKWINLIAPTTAENRIATLASSSSGFIYYVSREGVTGMQDKVAATVTDQVKRIQKHSKIPICVGFGVSTPDHVRTLAHNADGVVVGSAIVKVIAHSLDSPNLSQKIEHFVKPLAESAHNWQK